jgi:hypothetical protein
MGDLAVLKTYSIERSEDIVDDVTDALKGLGGSAHIGVLTDAVQAKLRADQGGPVRNLAADIEIALHAHDLDNKDRVKPALFKRPFGADSRRWTLHDAAPRAKGFSITRQAAE